MSVGDTAEERMEHIRRSSIGVFAAQGFKGTSMADLAEAAGMSRPALYQYFRNRGDVFRAALAAVLEDATDAALAALEVDGDVTSRLDGYLQRSIGDLHESLASLPHGAEIVDAKYEFAVEAADAALARRREGLERFLRRSHGLRGRRLSDLVDLIELSPLGLKNDDPDPAALRRRLTALARSVAADLAGSGVP